MRLTGLPVRFPGMRWVSAAAGQWCRACAWRRLMTLLVVGAGSPGAMDKLRGWRWKWEEVSLRREGLNAKFYRAVESLGS
jgi:hypothetical protein